MKPFDPSARSYVRSECASKFTGGGTRASTLRRDAEKARALGLLLSEHDRNQMETIAQRLEREALEIEIRQRPLSGLNL